MQKRIVLKLMLSLLANAHDYLYKSNLSSSQSMESTIMLV